MKNDCLVIRADATQVVGIGHVMRCLALAEAWILRAGDVYFIGHIDSDGLKERIASIGIALLPIENPNGQQEDLKQTLRYLNNLRKTYSNAPSFWAVLDGYEFDSTYQIALKNAGFRILVMDDIIHLSQYHADIILNQNIIPNNVDYQTDSSTVILAGPKYRLIRKEFFDSQDLRKEIPSKAKNLLLTFGGADTKNVTAKVIHMLNEIDDPDFYVKIVVGPTNARFRNLEFELTHSSYQYELLQTVDGFPSLISWADIGIATGGGTCFEMMLLGLPAILIPVNSNQKGDVRTLCEMGAALSLGRVENLDANEFITLLKVLILDPEKRQEMSRQRHSLIDRYSTDRIFSIMNAVASHLDPKKLVLRNAIQEDAKQLFRLANNPTVRSHSFSPDSLTFDDHLKWLEQKLLSPQKTAIWVYDYEGVILAQARYDKRDCETAEIDFSVHPAFRRKGLGSAILSQTHRLAVRWLNIRRVVGEVFESNIPSKRCFLSSGFTEKSKKVVKGYSCFVYEWDSTRVVNR